MLEKGFYFIWNLVQEISKISGMSEMGIVLLFLAVVLFFPVLNSIGKMKAHSGKYL